MCAHNILFPSLLICELAETASKRRAAGKTGGKGTGNDLLEFARVWKVRVGDDEDDDGAEGNVRESEEREREEREAAIDDQSLASYSGARVGFA